MDKAALRAGYWYIKDRRVILEDSIVAENLALP